MTHRDLRCRKTTQRRDTGKFTRFDVQELPSSCGPSRRYHIHKVLGTGNSAVVFQAALSGNRYNGRKVALKFLKDRREVFLFLFWFPKSHVMADRDPQSLDEVLIQSELHHPNIVEMHVSFIFKRSTYIVLDLCENGSLDDMIRARGYLTEPEVRTFTIQIAGALKYLRSKNIIHRDLTPRNIGLDANMNARIGDFGMAALLQSPGDKVFERCGTLEYMAPEVFQHDGYDRSVDLWSFGVIMYVFSISKIRRC